MFVRYTVDNDDDDDDDGCMFLRRSIIETNIH